MSGFSIIICSYNPNVDIFLRLLKAIGNLDTEEITFEVIIVDNNSNIPLSTINFVQEFLDGHSNATLILEIQPGLTSARIAGIERSKYDWIIFFDDDNEPAPNYLDESNKVINQYPQVGLWGPGNIEVNFIGCKQTAFLESQKALFQQRAIDGIQFDNNKIEGSDCYPFGTGLILKRTILESYASAVKCGLLTMTDRKSGNLSSGGDTQILYQGLKLGYYAGSAPSIKLSHNILKQKIKLKNLLKLIYHLNAGQVKAYNEVFTAHPYSITNVKQNMILNIFLIFTKRCLKHPGMIKFELLDLAKRLGMIKAQIIAGNQSDRMIITFWEKLIKA